MPEIFCCITKIPFKLIFNGNTKPHDVSGTSIISNNMMFKGTLMAMPVGVVLKILKRERQ